MLGIYGLCYSKFMALILPTLAGPYSEVDTFLAFFLTEWQGLFKFEILKCLDNDLFLVLYLDILRFDLSKLALPSLIIFYFSSKDNYSKVFVFLKTPIYPLTYFFICFYTLWDCFSIWPSSILKRSWYFSDIIDYAWARAT